jgi:hypothetical protein
MSTKVRYAKNGALIVGIPFLLWSIFLLVTVYSADDPSLGAVISFGIAFPGLIFGLPWSLISFPIGFLQVFVRDTIFETPVGFVGLAVFIAAPIVNGALLGYRIGAKKEKKLQEAECET